ncbi:MAG: DUF2332 family protein [Myxococcota bacterium]|nr:DUF2332 family protein [Myxococcota bacterium]
MAAQENSHEVAFRLQAGGCRYYGSPFYADLMSLALEDFLDGGCVADLVAGVEEDPVHGFLPLRLFGAVHARVLNGLEPELAAFYPSAGGRADAALAWPLIRSIFEREREFILSRLGDYPQTNETNRCVGMLGGFLIVARETGLPLRLREVGCSAGLNLQWNRFGYEVDGHRWGSLGSPVQLSSDWSGGLPPLDQDPAIESRAGCDLKPLDLEDPHDRLRLESFIWPDQAGRLDRLRAAIELAREEPPRIERAHAIDWLPGELADGNSGFCTVIFHSSVWAYIHEDEQHAISSLMETQGDEATPERPLAWLRQEGGEVPGTVEIRLRLWPAGEDRLLGMTHPQGTFVRWTGG